MVPHGQLKHAVPKLFKRVIGVRVVEVPNWIEVLFDNVCLLFGLFACIW